MNRKKKERIFLFSTLLIQDIAFNDVNCLKRYIFQWYFSPHENKYASEPMINLAFRLCVRPER